MARRDGATPRPGVLSEFRAALLAIRAQQWSQWATPGMAAEHTDGDRAIRAAEPVLLSASQVFAALDAIGDHRADIFAWGGDGYARDWLLTSSDELTPALEQPTSTDPT